MVCTLILLVLSFFTRLLTIEVLSRIYNPLVDQYLSRRGALADMHNRTDPVKHLH